MNLTLRACQLWCLRRYWRCVCVRCAQAQDKPVDTAQLQTSDSSSANGEHRDPSSAIDR